MLKLKLNVLTVRVQLAVEDEDGNTVELLTAPETPILHPVLPKLRTHLQRVLTETAETMGRQGIAVQIHWPPEIAPVTVPNGEKPAKALLGKNGKSADHGDRRETHGGSKKGAGKNPVPGDRGDGGE